MKIKQFGSVSVEWLVVCSLFSIVLFYPFIDGKSVALMMFEAVQTALDNSAAIVSLP